jgi:hypothetical protein
MIYKYNPRCDFLSFYLGFLWYPKVMPEFLKMLTSRRDAAKKRIEAARKELADAEAELVAWSQAVALEERTGLDVTGERSGDNGDTKGPMMLSADNVRTKEDILLSYLKAALQPLKISDIVEMVRPAVSRSSVYRLLETMEKNGTVYLDAEGKYHLNEREEKTK